METIIIYRASILIGFVILIIDWKPLWFSHILFYTVTILLLILVLFSSDSTGGAHHGLDLVVLKSNHQNFLNSPWIQHYLKCLVYNKQNKYSFKSMIGAYIIILIPFLLIILQNDLGTKKISLHIIYFSFL